MHEGREKTTFENQLGFLYEAQIYIPGEFNVYLMEG